MGKQLTLTRWLVSLWRPMTYEGTAFWDHIEKRGVYYFRDHKGQRWMKNSRFGLFGVKAKD